MAVTAYAAFRFLASNTNKILFVIISIVFCLFAALGLGLAITALENTRYYPYSFVVPISNLLFLVLMGWLFKTYNPWITKGVSNSDATKA